MKLNNVKKTLTIIFLLAAFIFITSSIYADILVLSDGTVLVGKIVEETEDEIRLNNSYKLFVIKKSQIKNVFITNNYKEDVTIYKGLGLEPDEVVIKKDYLAGLEKLAKKDTETSKEIKETWSGRISVLTCFNGTVGDLQDILPYSYGFTISYDQTFYKYLKPSTKKFLPLIPYLRAEIEYNRYEKEPATLDKAGFFVGPVWSYPVVKKEWGYLKIATLPGIVYLNGVNGSRKDSGIAYGQNTFLGYEFSIVEKLTFFAHLRYTFIADQSTGLHGIGLSLGLGYIIW